MSAAPLLEQTKEYRESAGFIKSLARRSTSASIPTNPPLRFAESRRPNSNNNTDVLAKLSERETMHRIQALCSKYEELMSTISQEEVRHKSALTESIDLRNAVTIEKDIKVADLKEQLQGETERRTRLEQDVSLLAAHSTDNFHVKQLSDQLQKKIEVANDLQRALDREENEKLGLQKELESAFGKLAEERKARERCEESRSTNIREMRVLQRKYEQQQLQLEKAHQEIDALANERISFVRRLDTLRTLNQQIERKLKLSRQQTRRYGLVDKA